MPISYDKQPSVPTADSPSPTGKISYARPRPAVPLAGVDLAKRAPGLVDLHKKAGVSLVKNNLSGVRAAVYLVLDHSGSMRRFYKDGTVQSFTERVLAAAAHFDDDGVVPVVFFDSRAHPVVEISIDAYDGAVDRLEASAGRMGTTNYADAMTAVIEHHRSSGAGEPAFVVFETDGSPDSRSKAERVLCDAAHLPIFWQFVGFGSDSFDFLRKLDDLAVPRRRVVDNAGFFEAGRDPRAMPPEVLYDHLMSEFPQWLAQARRQGIVSA